MAQRMEPIKIVEIVTGKRSEEEVAQLISGYSKAIYGGHPFENRIEMQEISLDGNG